MDRREFLKRSAAIGATVPLGTPLIHEALVPGSSLSSQGNRPDIAVVTGSDYFASTLKAVEMLGGMERFVMRGAKVGLLVNSPWDNPGTYTNPDVALAVLKMCLNAGAAEIYSVEDASEAYWNRSALAADLADEIAGLKPSGGKDVTVEIPNGERLKEAVVSKALMDCDVIIDIPICKDHDGTRYTGTLKNMMGACIHDPTNRFMHLGSGAEEFYGDPEHLSQCIADLNLVRAADLSVVDATEFVTTNGPQGPGEILRPQQVVAGTDMVAVDSYCAEVRGLRSQDVQMINMAHAHGLGEMDISSLQIQTEDLGD